MNRLVAPVILAALAGLSCDSSDSEPVPKPGPAAEPAAASNIEADGEGNVAQARIGGDPGVASPHLDFAIIAVYEQHKPTDAPPWHEPGGEWTFFDAEVGGGGFTAGFKAKPVEGMPFEIGEGFVVAQSAESGGAFVAALAKAFGQPTPKSASSGAAKLKPINSAPVILGREVARAPDGSFSGEGDWIAAKYTFETQNGANEVFVNINLKEKKGELTEKDSSYNAGLVEDLAKGLRDGNYPAL